MLLLCMPWNIVMFMQVPDAVTSNEENAGERTKDNKTAYDVYTSEARA